MSRKRNPPAGLWLPAVVIAFTANIPLIYVFVRAFEGGTEGWLSAITSPLTAGLAWRTTMLAISVAVLTIAIAVPAAFLAVRSDLPFRRGFAVLFGLPLLFPSYVAAFSLISFFGPKGVLHDWIGVERLPDFAYGFSGALITLALFTYPYTYLLVFARLARIDPALEESARSLGRSRWGAVRSVVLPQLRAPIFGGTLLVVLYTISDFGAVSLVRYNTFTLGIYDAYRTLFDRSVAASLATLLICATLVVTWLETIASGRLAGEEPTVRTPRILDLGRFRIPALIFAVLICGAAVGVPLATVGWWSWKGASSIAFGELLRIALGSMALAMGAAVVAVIFSIPVALWRLRYRGKLGIVTERLSYSGYALPGLIVALSLVFLAARHLPFIYQTMALLLTGYVLRFLPEALTATRTALGSVSLSFEESARLLGRGRIAAFLSTTLRVASPGIAAGLGLVFLTTVKELPITVILRPTGFETLATRIWSTTAEGFFAQAGAPSLALIVISAAPLWFLVIRPVLSSRRVAT